MAEYKHGEMDITTQTETFDGFMNFVTKTVIAILVLVVLMAIFITCSWYFIKSYNSCRCTWSYLFNITSVIKLDRLDTSICFTNDYIVTYMQCTIFDNHISYWSKTFFKRTFNNNSFCFSIWICFKFHDFRLEKNRLK